MNENDRLNPQKNEAYFQTLSRNQQISFTRRIRFEYEKQQNNRKKRPDLPKEWQTSNNGSDQYFQIRNFEEIHVFKDSNLSDDEEDLEEGKHELDVVRDDDIRIIEPVCGVTYFNDFDDEDFRYIQSVALHSLDDIIIKSHKKPFKNPRKPKTASSNSNSTIFELDLSRVIELDSSLSSSETKIPILIECLLKSSDRMVQTSGIFRKSSAVCTITDLKSRIINVYENHDSSKCLKSRVSSVLEEEKFNTPNIHAAMLKNFLQNLPEPLLIPGYKKIFNIITCTTKIEEKLQILNLLFIILPRNGFKIPIFVSRLEL